MTAVPIRDELIERAVKQLAAAFARLITGRAVNVTEAEAGTMRAEIAELYRRFIGTSSDLVKRLSTEDLLGVLGSAGYVDGERAYLLSALLETEAQLEVAQGAAPDDPAVASLRERSLDLALEAGIEELGEPDLPGRVERLLGVVPRHARSAATWERLVGFWQAQGVWSKAEDAVFAWLDEVESGSGDEARLRAVAERFYGHLGELDDDTLASGGLPREELAEGRSEVLTRLAGVPD